MSDFRGELNSLINRYSKENGSNTPDFILADYLIDCLRALDIAVSARDRWTDQGKGKFTIRVDMTTVNPEAAK